jgi:hypothetical protein
MGQLNETLEQVQSDMDNVWEAGSSIGIKVDQANPTFPWHDLIGLIQPDTSNPTTAPTKTEFRTGINAYAYSANDELDTTYHIPHDWLPSCDALSHLHWAHNGTAISGTLTVSAIATYSDRDTGGFGAPVTLANISVSTPDVATIPQYMHYVTEVPLMTSGGSGTSLDSDDIEVDGLVLISFKVTSVPTVTAGDLFIFTGDIHYQSTGIGTKQNASPFYT